MFATENFLLESNRIEGIPIVTEQELQVADDFLQLPAVTSYKLAEYVRVTANAKLREQVGMDVRVGSFYPPRGGPRIGVELSVLMGNVNAFPEQWHEHHLQYEKLHPFTDGNGRSGRLLWLWARLKCHQRPVHGKFLQQFYYDTLRAAS